MQKAVIIMGPPSSGKGTQADFIAHEYELLHYDTGARLRELIAEDKIPNNAYDAGKLINSNWILQLVKGELRPLTGKTGVALSGSPRTVLEAFGDDENEGIVDFLVDAYGENSVVVFSLNISEEESILRSKKRGTKRSDGKPEIVRKRYEDQYLNKVKPTIEEISKRGFNVFEIDGMPDPETVFGTVEKILDVEFN